MSSGLFDSKSKQFFYCAAFLLLLLVVAVLCGLAYSVHRRWVRQNRLGIWKPGTLLVDRAGTQLHRVRCSFISAELRNPFFLSFWRFPSFFLTVKGCMRYMYEGTPKEETNTMGFFFLPVWAVSTAINRTKIHHFDEKHVNTIKERSRAQWKLSYKSKPLSRVAWRHFTSEQSVTSSFLKTRYLDFIFHYKIGTVVERTCTK